MAVPVWDDRDVRHTYDCPIRRADLRPGGTVDNVVFADYLQEARLHLLRRHGSVPSPQPGEGLVVVRTVIEYVAPLRLSDAPLVASVWPTQVRAASFTLGYELTSGDADKPVVHARATTVLTPFDFNAERPRRLTPEERAMLTHDLEESPVSDERRAPAGTWSPPAFCQDVLVRFSDIDQLGHVNNVRYLDYVQEAIADLSTEALEEAGVPGRLDPVVARTEIDYLGQMELRAAPYDVWCRVVDVGSGSVTFESEIRDGARVMARCRVVEVSDVVN